MEKVEYPQHDFPTAILTNAAHRPWPIPGRSWVMTQTWHDLLFAHWPVPAESLARLIPSPFELDLFEGRAWLGIVPFVMTNVAPRGVPALPGLSSFPELNVRTYVRVGGRPGVYFFSLDAASVLAVRAARLLLHLPYYWASMTVARSSAGVHYRSRRRGNATPHEFVATYKPAGPVFKAEPRSLEYFLTERYCLYGRDHRDRPYRLEIHHPAWRLQAADAVIERNSMFSNDGISLPAVAPVQHFAKRQDTLAWLPTRL
jgi:uncharacterized protein